MTSPPKILCTFVGDVARDSRLLRMARTLSQHYAVEILSLAGEGKRYRIGDITVTQRARADQGSLRASLRAFWRIGDEIADASGASLLLASDLYSLPLAAKAARKRSTPLLYDSRELYSAIAALTGRPLTQWYWRIIERRYAPRSSAILTVNDTIARRLGQSFPHTPVVVLHNYPSWQAGPRTDTLRRRLGIPDGRVILLSQGGLQAGRGALLLVDALPLLDNHHLVFLGSGPLADAIARRAEERRVTDRVDILTDVLSDELGGYTASADIGCCVIENLGASYHASLPNKLFEYIAAGIPVVASDFPEIARIVDAEQVGVTLDPSDPRHVADAVRRLSPQGELYRSCSDRCRTSRAKFQWEGEGERLLSVVRSVMDHGVPGAR
jgi:glycosyltransferase involved in cell wall biosynthesis